MRPHHSGRRCRSGTSASDREDCIRQQAKGDSTMSTLLRGNRRHLLKGALRTAGVVALGSRSIGNARAQSVKLTNVEHDSRPLDNAAYEAVYKAFREQHPDIEIEFQIIPWEQ